MMDERGSRGDENWQKGLREGFNPAKRLAGKRKFEEVEKKEKKRKGETFPEAFYAIENKRDLEEATKTISTLEWGTKTERKKTRAKRPTAYRGTKKRNLQSK